MQVKLRANTRKAKNRIHEAGTDLWQVLQVAEVVQHSTEPGPWLLVQPGANDRLMRWVRGTGDFHFKVVVFAATPEEVDRFHLTGL